MEIIKHKKEVMRAVKTTLIFLCLFCIWNGVHSQNIKGKFQRADPATAARGITVQLSFSEGQKFEKIEYQHLGAQEKSHGTYRIIKDTLILNYKNYQEPAGNSVDITEKEKINPMGTDFQSLPLYSLIQVFEAPGIPKSGVNLLLRSADQEIIMAFISDEKGFFPNLSIYDHYIKDFQFSAFGKQETVIDTDSLFGFRTKINIFFEDFDKIEISRENYLEKFLIKDISENEIELFSLGERELVQLKKIQKK